MGFCCPTHTGDTATLKPCAVQCVIKVDCGIVLTCFEELNAGIHKSSPGRPERVRDELAVIRPWHNFSLRLESWHSNDSLRIRSNYLLAWHFFVTVHCRFRSTGNRKAH